MSHILVVDDDRDHADSVADILILQGHQVDVAFSGEEAADRAQEIDFDIALLDIKLPGVNGVETCRRVKAMKPRVQIIMMTGFSVEKLIQSAIDSGAAGVIYKPFAISRLIEALQRMQQPDGAGQPQHGLPA